MVRFFLVLVVKLVFLFGVAHAATVKNTNSKQGHAFFFAIDQYENLTDLNNPIKDAKAIALVLEEHYSFSTEVIENPTIDKIDSIISEIQTAYANGVYAASGQLVFYFTGHGKKSNGNGYFLASDSDPKRPQRTALEYDYYRNKIDQINCQHILVIIDACDSASFDPNFNSRNGDRRFKRKGEEDFDNILSNHRNFKARCFWTSDALGKETPDRSNFAYSILEGLRGFLNDNKPYLRSSELFAVYVEKARPAPGGGNFGEDEPGSCFLFFARKEIDFISSSSLVSVPRGLLNNIGQLPGKGSHVIKIDDFQIGKYEVTNIDFVEFLNQETLRIEKGNVFLDGNVIFDLDCTSCRGWWEQIDYIDGEFIVRNGYEYYPVVLVSWHGAAAYGNWLSKEYGYQPVYSFYEDGMVETDYEKNGFRLPRESEWEYAARSLGNQEEWSGTNDLLSLDRYMNGAGEKDAFKYASPVGSFLENALGLYDMSGNVWEWCNDWYGEYTNDQELGRNQGGPESGVLKVVRGGSWNSEVLDLKTTFRYSYPPKARYNNVGFRLARNL